MLQGRVYSARLYDRALTEDEIQALASKDGSILPLSRLLHSMTSEERNQWQQLESERAASEAIRSAWPEEDRRDDVWRPWRDLALALFNLKEFLYVR